MSLTFDQYVRLVKNHYDNGDHLNPNSDWSDVSYVVDAVDTSEEINPQYKTKTFVLDPRSNMNIANINDTEHRGLTKRLLYLPGGLGVDAQGNLTVYVGGYPLVAGYVGNIHLRSDMVVTENLVIVLDFANRAHSSEPPVDLRNIGEIGKGKTFDLISVNAAAPSGWEKHFKPNYYVPPYKRTAISVEPNDFDR